MANEMVERVALVITANGDFTTKYAECLAKSIIAAMREPTEKMKQASFGAELEWIVMIDAALKE